MLIANNWLYMSDKSYRLFIFKGQIFYLDLLKINKFFSEANQFIFLLLLYTYFQRGYQYVMASLKEKLVMQRDIEKKCTRNP